MIDFRESAGFRGRGTMADKDRTTQVEGKIDYIQKIIEAKLDGFSKRLDDFGKQLEGQRGLLLWSLGTLVGVILVIVAGGFFLTREIGSVRENIIALKPSDEDRKKVTDALDKLTTFETDVRTALGSILARVPAQTDRLVPLVLNESEQQQVKKFIALKPQGKPAAFKVGDMLPSSVALFPLPKDLVAAVPRLKEFRYAVDDQSGAILFVGIADNRVVAILL
jgi:hypothetical protein